MKLHCENLVKKYGIRTVVKGVSMEVEQGEIVGFLGPNGAGKTTSFYMITGQIVPNAGRIFLDDEEITDLPMYKRAQKALGRDVGPDDDAGEQDKDFEKERKQLLQGDKDKK